MLLDFLPDIKRVNFSMSAIFLRYVAVEYVIQVHSPERHVNKGTESRVGGQSADAVVADGYPVTCDGDVRAAMA